MTEFKIEEGKFYRTREGRKRGPAVRQQDWWVLGSFGYYSHGERMAISSPSLDDLIAEWTDEPTGPVIIETRKRIREGTFGIVNVSRGPWDTDDPHWVGVPSQIYTASELRAAADVFIQLADALDEPR